MSDLKSILVHLDLSPRSSRRLEIAAELARLHDAKVTALYAVSSIFTEYPYAIAGSPESAAALKDIEDASLAAARVAFDKATRAQPERFRWASVTMRPERAMSYQARFADLLILGQHEPGKDTEASLAADFVEYVLIEGGRPALVVPYVAAPPSIGRVALVAWKNTREAARAVGAALPLLRRCERVHVVTWAEESDVATSPLDIEQYLAMQGVRCKMHRGAALESAVGEALLSRLADVSADLLVMGCYGHSRAREWVLGGVTRSVLASMTVPVLMSH